MLDLQSHEDFRIDVSCQLFGHQTFHELPEADSVSEVQEQLVPEHEEESVSEAEQSVSQVVKPLLSDAEGQLTLSG